MLSARKVFEALQQTGVKVLGYEESKDPELMDGEVILENSLSVQVGFDYACVSLIKEDSIDYLLEIEDVKNEVVIAQQVAGFLETWQP